MSAVREASIAVPGSLRNSAAVENGDKGGNGVDKKVDGAQNSAEANEEDQDVMEVVEVEEDEAEVENETIKAREEGESEGRVEGGGEGAEGGMKGGADDCATAYTPLPIDPLPLHGTLPPIDGSALGPTAAGDGGALERPHLALHKKHAELGLAFFTRNSFIAWHNAVAPVRSLVYSPPIVSTT